MDAPVLGAHADRHLSCSGAGRIASTPLHRGDVIAVWAGLTQQEDYRKTDVWPFAPEGEVLVILMIGDTQGVDNLGEILAQAPGMGVVLIGNADLSLTRSSLPESRRRPVREQGQCGRRPGAGFQLPDAPPAARLRRGGEGLELSGRGGEDRVAVTQGFEPWIRFRV